MLKAVSSKRGRTWTWMLKNVCYPSSLFVLFCYYWMWWCTHCIGGRPFRKTMLLKMRLETLTLWIVVVRIVSLWVTSKVCCISPSNAMFRFMWEKLWNWQITDGRFSCAVLLMLQIIIGLLHCSISAPRKVKRKSKVESFHIAAKRSFPINRYWYWPVVEKNVYFLERMSIFSTIALKISVQTKGAFPSCNKFFSKEISFSRKEPPTFRTFSTCGYWQPLDSQYTSNCPSNEPIKA